MGEKETGDVSFVSLNAHRWICWEQEEVGLERIGHLVCWVESMEKLVIAGGGGCVGQEGTMTQRAVD